MEQSFENPVVDGWHLRAQINSNRESHPLEENVPRQYPHHDGGLFLRVLLSANGWEVLLSELSGTMFLTAHCHSAANVYSCCID